ncbi:MAG: hypothetical protein JWM47_2990 [Acidimicrobiales bacterium]|nr:hypothetical protein [Acidimicrobiales bacterium]
MRDDDLDPDAVDGPVRAGVDQGWGQPVEVPADPLPSRVVKWSRSSAIGAVMTGMALGLQEVLEPKRDVAIVIEVDADGEPHDLPIRLLLDPDDPSGSLCFVRRDPPPPLV